MAGGLEPEPPDFKSKPKLSPRKKLKKKIQNVPVKDTREIREKTQNKCGFCFPMNNKIQYTNRSSSLAYELFLDHGNFLHKLSRCSNMAPALSACHMSQKSYTEISLWFNRNIHTYMLISFRFLLSCMLTPIYINHVTSVNQSINHCQKMYRLDVRSNKTKSKFSKHQLLQLSVVLSFCDYQQNLVIQIMTGPRKQGEWLVPLTLSKKGPVVNLNCICVCGMVYTGSSIVKFMFVTNFRVVHLG